MPSKPRVLVMSHAHPDFSLGGGEIAAYNLYRECAANPDIEAAWFLARADRGRGPCGAIGLRRPNEYLWEQGIHDWHLLKAAHAESVTGRFQELVTALQPTVVHTHHYAHMGLEYLRILRRSLPGVRIVMTLHEYMAICRNNGQMIKVGSGRLCSSESPEDCRQCFPEKSAEDFWLRRHFLHDHFRLVDAFVAPSEFLRQRYIRWGLPAEKIIVIENGQPAHEALPPRPLAGDGPRNRFAYFGQINPYKGLTVLLEALTQLPRILPGKGLTLEVHGANLEKQDGELQQKIRALAEPLIKRKLLNWVGPYRPEEQRQRMAGVDWVLVPSIWWENSPMVIQEAFACGRPVIASDIGGMAEKVRHGVDGLHVRMGSASHWAETLQAAATTPGLWDRLAAGIRRPLTTAECLEAHWGLYTDRRQGQAA